MATSPSADFAYLVDELKAMSTAADIRNNLLISKLEEIRIHVAAGVLGPQALQNILSQLLTVSSGSETKSLAELILSLVNLQAVFPPAP